MPNLSPELLRFERMQMKRQYLHLSVYRCDTCQGPVVTASLAVRENEISRETDKRELGARCLACGHQQIASSVPGVARHFPPTEWQGASTVNPSSLKAAFVEALGRESKD
jgi:DNA-directed RNA polymerase subunit RPC12/RpoP